MTTGTLYTIGYQALAPQRLLQIAQGLDATVIDVRKTPVSRIKGYHKCHLQALLGARYEARGAELGGIRNGISNTSLQGINHLRADLAAGRNLILMCMEYAPADCHRHQLICAPHFPRALHIFEHALIEAAALQAALDDPDPDAEYDIAGHLDDLVPACPFDLAQDRLFQHQPA